MTIDELELERLTQEIIEYVSDYLRLHINQDEWMQEVNFLEFKYFIKEVIKHNVFTFGRDDSYIIPMYKSFVLGLRAGSYRRLK